MRGDLEKVPGVIDIVTDIETNTATFRYDPEQVDIDAKLTELGESNDHIAGWSRADESEDS